jgi:signal peptidase I
MSSMGAPTRIRNKEEGGLYETIKVVVQALLIALVVRTLLFQPFNIPSGSLIPTLLIGDYLFVSKYSYGYSKHSMPFSPPFFSGRIGDFGSPQRGDIAVFKLPTDNSTDYIKRVIGLPGDKIQVLDGVVNINGRPVEKKRIAISGRRTPMRVRSPFRATSRRCPAAPATRSSSATATGAIGTTPPSTPSRPADTS